MLTLLIFGTYRLKLRCRCGCILTTSLLPAKSLSRLTVVGAMADNSVYIKETSHVQSLRCITVKASKKHNLLHRMKCKPGDHLLNKAAFVAPIIPEFCHSSDGGCCGHSHKELHCPICKKVFGMLYDECYEYRRVHAYGDRAILSYSDK